MKMLNEFAWFLAWGVLYQVSLFFCIDYLPDVGMAKAVSVMGSLAILIVVRIFFDKKERVSLKRIYEQFRKFKR